MRVCGTGLGNGWFDNSVGWRVQNGKDIYIVLESSWGGKSNFSPTLGETIQHFLQHKCVWMRVTNVVAWWAVWCAISWSIWTHRNNVLFRQGNIDMDSVIGVIKFKSWLWYSNQMGTFRSSYYEWLSQPALCLKVVWQLWRLMHNCGSGLILAIIVG